MIQNKLNEYVNKWYGWMLGEVKRNIAKDMMSEYATDLLHHIILDLYNMNEDKITQMIDDDKLRWYVLRGCALQLKSSTSPFYRTHRKEKFQSRENFVHNGDESFSGKGILEQIYEPYSGDDLWDCFQREMDNLHWYQKTLMNRYWMENWTLDEMYKHYNISKTHLIRDLNKAMDTIRENCKEC